jgi:hypothetical protein
MNINDRKRIAELVQCEFRARRAAVMREPTVDEIAKEMEAILIKNKLRDKAAKLTEARTLVATLEKSLSVSVAALSRQAKIKKRRRYDGCECYDDYMDLLQEVAKANIAEARKSQEHEEEILAQERKLLAKVEIAKSVEDLEKIVKAAGLV